jgi:hypothetical protein
MAKYMRLSSPEITLIDNAYVAEQRYHFASDELVFNISVRELRVGPGLWADCSVVLAPGSGGSVAWGAITGDIPAQEDLVNLLDEYLAFSGKADAPVYGLLADLSSNTQIPSAGTLIIASDAGRIYITDGSRQVSQIVAAGIFFATTGGVLRYKAILSQTGTSAPVAVGVLEDTIGGDWFYDGKGAYRYTKAGVFLSGKVWATISPSCNSIERVDFRLERSNNNDIVLTTSDSENDRIKSHMVLIEVYP